MLNYAEIGQRIRALRKKQGLSQEQLAERVWISTTHMSHIETGTTKLSLPVLVDLADALGVGTDDILSIRTGNDKKEAIDNIYSLLASCDNRQAKIIEEIIISTKAAMDAYL